MTDSQSHDIIWIKPDQEITISVPATSANLGPGYDSMGLALNVTEKVIFSTFESTDNNVDNYSKESSGEMTVEIVGGEDLDILIPRNGKHLIVASMLRFWEYVSEQADVQIKCAGIKIDSQYLIPLSRGLGSSAAAIVAGVVAAARLLPHHLQPYQKEAFNVACQIEGHPDNIAPAFFGGMTLSWTNPAGQIQQMSSDLDSKFVTSYGPYSVVRFLPDAQLTPVVAVPNFQASTSDARKMLPDRIAHSEAAKNSANAALMVYSMVNNSPYLLSASEDYLHQRYRAEIMPESALLIDILRQRSIPAVISGAGPTVLAFGSSAQQAQAIESMITEVTADLSSYAQDYNFDNPIRDDVQWKIFTTTIAGRGVEFSSLTV